MTSASRSRGTAASSASSSFSLGDPAAALVYLERAWAIRDDVQLLEPGHRLELADTLEALVSVGDLEGAERRLRHWEERARACSIAPGRSRSPRATVRFYSLPRATSMAPRSLSDQHWPSTHGPRIRSSALERCSCSVPRSGGRSSAARHARRWPRRSPRSSESALRSGSRRLARSTPDRWPCAVGRRADGGRAPDREVRRRRSHEPRGRGGALHHGAHRRGSADTHVPEARYPLARRAAHGCLPRIDKL